MIQPAAIIRAPPNRLLLPTLSPHTSNSSAPSLPPSSPISYAPSVRIRNLILDQLHIRNLVSTGYTTEDTGEDTRIGEGGWGEEGRGERVARSLTPGAFFRGCLRDGRERERGGLAERAEVVETGRHTNLLNYDPRLQL